MKELISQCLLSLGTGAVTGVLFALVKLPVPAPNLVGVFGVVGLTLGYLLFNKLFM